MCEYFRFRLHPLNVIFANEFVSKKRKLQKRSARAHTERKRNEDKQNPTRENKRVRMATSATSSLLSVGSMRSALFSSSTTSRDAVASSSSTSSSGFARASKKMLSSAQRRTGTNVRGSVDTNTNKENCRKRVVASSMPSSSSSSSETKSEAEKFSENIVLEKEEEEEESISTTRKTSNTIDEEKVADLTKKKEELKQKQMEMQRAIDTAYESLFEGVSMADAEEEMGKEENELTADVSDAFVEDFPITTEKKFKIVERL